MYFIITLLIIVSLVAVRDNHKFDFFTKEKTYFLKAMLPYVIIVHHSHLYNWDFRSAGPFVVAIFFFMSGYGLETKHIMGGAKSINNDFLVNALRKLIIPLIVPITIFLTLRLFNVSFSVIFNEDIRKYQLILPNTWFVVTLIILYFLFSCCVIMKYKLKTGNTLYLLSIITVVLGFILVGKKIGIPSFGFTTTTAFIAGILYKNYEASIISRLNRYPVVNLLIFAIMFILLTMFIKGDISHKYTFIEKLWTPFVWASLFMLLYDVIPAIKHRSWSRTTIDYLSSISYELYVCQAIAFLVLGDRTSYNSVIYLVLLFILCTLIASGCKSVTNKIVKNVSYSI